MVDVARRESFEQRLLQLQGTCKIVHLKRQKDNNFFLAFSLFFILGGVSCLAFTLNDACFVINVFLLLLA